MIVQLPGVDPNDPAVRELLASMPDESKVRLFVGFYDFYYLVKKDSDKVFGSNGSVRKRKRVVAKVEMRRNEEGDISSWLSIKVLFCLTLV